MNKRDYVKLAEIIKGSTRIDCKDSIKKSSFLFYLCGILKQDSLRFDKDKFLEACKTPQD